MCNNYVYIIGKEKKCYTIRNDKGEKIASFDKFYKAAIVSRYLQGCKMSKQYEEVAEKAIGEIDDKPPEELPPLVIKN